MSNRRPLNIGITCYPTYGGSGVIATELGMAMAARGHRVHFIAYDIPRRLNRFLDNVFFHEVELRENPVFLNPPYTLALCSKMVDVATNEKIDLLHVHYAVPHATSAYLAKQILRARAPKILTTLHGTDITLVGHDRSYLPITRFSIEQSDEVTAPSQFLKEATFQKLGISPDRSLLVIPNFVDIDEFKPLTGDTPCAPRPRLSECSTNDKVLIHVSNFRPVKQVDQVVKVFDLVQKQIPCHLILVGDGPERSSIEQLVKELGLRKKVCFFGKQDSVAEILQRSHVFLLPSKNESFGLAALEAMSCGIPVVASRVEGIPEVVIDGEVGFLATPDDVEEMAKHTLTLLKDDALYSRMSKQARKLAVEKYSKEALATQFENLYYSMKEAAEK